MHLFVGALLVLGGLGCLRYVFAGETAFESEPPFLALSVLLIGIGTGLALRARAALLLTQVALGGTLLVIVTRALRLYVGGPRDTPDDSLVALVYLFGFALAAAGVVVLFLLLRRVHAEAAFGAIDYVPLGVLAAHHCRSVARGPCGLQRYAAGIVDARAGRFDAAKEAFLWACETDRSWCARAAEVAVPWTVDERKRLSDRRR